MPFIPEGTPPNLLAAVPATQWSAWADGTPAGRAPHQQPPKSWGMRLNKSFRETASGIDYKAGMQGRLLEVSQDNKMAKIYIEGVTEGRDHENRWVPNKYIEKGKPWETNLAKWRLNVRIAKTSFNTYNWNSAAVPDTTVLGRTITLMLTALRSSPPDFAVSKLTKFFDRNNVAVISRIIIEGIQKAGLYEILSSPKPFSYEDLLSAARYRINHSVSTDVTGIYARFHVSSKDVYGWKPEASYCYVGKANDIGARHSSHKGTTTLYGNLTRGSEMLEMCALCILERTDDDGLVYLTEQIFLCLLQCYKESVLLPVNIQTGLVKFSGPARFLKDLADEVFRMTGWQGGVERQSFKITYGANCSSPLLEYATKFDSFLYIRTDRIVRDKETGVATPMAFYRRADRVKATDDSTAPEDKEERGKTHNVSVLKKHVFCPRRAVISFSVHGSKNDTAADLPFPGTPYQFVIEVRKDGSTHPYAWARLPEVGRYENSRQANSFAVRVEWEHPPNSGKWRFRYIQSQMIYDTAIDSVPGALITYAKAISFLQWLTNSKPNHNLTWIHRLPGAAHVLQAEYNFMDQTVTFVKPSDDILMLPARVRPDNTIIAHMQDPKFGLSRVNGAFGVFDSGLNAKGKRIRCDTCLLLAKKLSLMKSRVAWDGSCVQIAGTNLCTNCRTFGRPCCSWTRTLISHPEGNYTPSERKANEVALSALVSLPPKMIPANLQSFTQELLTLERSNNMDDDGSDCEDEDESGDEDD